MTLALIFVAGSMVVAIATLWLFPVLRWLHLPVSIVAGFIGLAIVLSFQAKGISQDTMTEMLGHLRSWPGWLISVVFACMLLAREPSSPGDAVRRAGREGLMVWIIVLGQTAIGLLVTWLFIQPFSEVPDAFGMLIETGFAGGHGTAAAMGKVFENPQIQLAAGLDLGVMMATVGLVYGIISGVFWVNLGVRYRWTQTPLTAPTDSSMTSTDITEEIGEPAKVVAGVDSLMLQMIWITLAFAAGWAMQSLISWCIGGVERWLLTPSSSNELLQSRLSLSSIHDNFPLFIYTLFGGFLVRWMLTCWRCQSLIDRAMISRLSSISMDVLVVAAIASLKLSAISGQISNLLILILAAAVWTSVCLVVLSRWILPKSHWFELGLINYGMSTGTTATGFVLLRMVDPELRSGAAEDYALAAPISSPFVGGGMITIGLPLLLLGRVPLGIVACILSIIVVTLIGLGRILSHKSDRTTP